MTGIASRAQLRMSLLRYALVTVPLLLLLGTTSTGLADAGSGWYPAWAKPAFAPPAWAFAVGWTVAYVLLGLALAMLLHARGAYWRRPGIALFVVLLLLAFAWSPVLLGFGAILEALMLAAAIVLIALVLTAVLWWTRRGAALLMLVFLGWAGFLAALSWSLAELNPSREVAPQPASTDITL